MKHSAFLMTALMAFSTVTYAGQQAELRSYEPKAPQISADALLAEADKCWNQEGSYEQNTIWENSEGKLSLALRKFSQRNSTQPVCYVSITIPVKAVDERCEGINTLAFLGGGKTSLASGDIKNTKGQYLSSLFSHYQGRAQGAALLAGVGRWTAKTDKGISIEGTIGAIPVPILGGNVGLGYTSCDLSFELAPEKNEAEVYLSIHQGNKVLKGGKRIIPLEQILSLPL